MAEKRTISLEVELENGDKVIKQFEQLDNGVKKLADSAENLDAKFEDVYKGVEPLTTRLGEAEDRLYELALAGDTTSKEYQELLTKVGEYRKVQIETDLAVDGAATTMTQKLGSALNGVTSGFATTQGALALFGSENEKLEKSLLKVQAALAIQQGVNGLRTAYKELGGATGLATKAQAALNFVMNLNPFVLIATAIAAAVAALATFTSVLDPVIDGFKSLTDAIGLTNYATDEYIEASKKQEQASVDRRNAIDKEIEALDRQIDREKNLTSVKLRRIALDQAEAKSTDEAVKLQEEATEEKIKLNDKEYANFIEKQKKTLEAHKEEAKILQGIIDRNIARGRSDHKSELAQLEARKKHIIKLNNDILHNNFDFYQENQVAREEIEKEGEKAIDNIRKDANNKYQTYLQNRLSAARKIEDLENELKEEGAEKELEINRDKFRRLREDAKKNTELTRDERKKIIDLYDKQELAQQKVINQKYIDLEKQKNAKIDEEKAKANKERIDKEDALFELELSLMKDRQMAEIIALTQQYDKKFELANGNAELERQLTEQQEADIAAIEDKYRKEKEAKDKEASDKEKADALATQQAKIQFANDALGAIGDLANAFAGDSEKSQRRAFKINKAVGLAQAIINTAGAVSAAINPAVGGLGIPAGLPGAILAAATGAAQIATIAKTKFEGGSTGDVSAPSESGLGAVQAPEFNVVGDAGINQLAQLQQQPTQAFVVSGEVTSAQALDRNRVTNATL